LSGRRLLRIRGWTTRRGQSPNVPYFEEKKWEERYVALPDEAFIDDAPLPWTISSNDGETEDPLGRD